MLSPQVKIVLDTHQCEFSLRHQAIVILAFDVSKENLSSLHDTPMDDTIFLSKARIYESMHLQVNSETMQGVLPASRACM